MMFDFIQSVQNLLSEGESFVTITLTDVKGSAPQIIGAKMIVSQNGLYWGTIGGGKIEAHCISQAKNMITQNLSSASYTWNLQTDIGMSCGGEVTLFFDIFSSDLMNISVFGAGHVSQALCRILYKMKCKVNVYDTRLEWLDKLPKSKNIKTHLVDDLKSKVNCEYKNHFLICMTMGHATDLPILIEALKSYHRFKFIGVIGSKVKAMKLKDELKKNGISNEGLNFLTSPIGLPIGDNTPIEIAISIISQLLAVRDKISVKI